MKTDLSSQIYQNLNAKETEELLDIWQNGDANDWNELAFKIIADILQERLGQIPAVPTQRQVSAIFITIVAALQKGEYDRALAACEQAIQLMPDSAIAYNFRGAIYDELGQVEQALPNFQRAIQLDPDYEVAWENMRIDEKLIEEEFQESAAKQHLDQAIQYFDEDDLEKAMAECELAKSTLPNIAAAYTYLGQFLEEIQQLQPAIEAYLRAIQLNPRFFETYENLSNARKKLEAEQYHQITLENQLGGQTEFEISSELDEDQISEIPIVGDIIPQWFYLDETAHILPGWAGHRTRQGRSGYDPLDSEFENARMEGVLIRKIFTINLRTKNPIYLLIIAYVGLLFCLPLMGIAAFITGEWDPIYISSLIGNSPYWIVGIMIWVNVFLSIFSRKPDECEMNGYAFF